MCKTNHYGVTPVLVPIGLGFGFGTALGLGLGPDLGLGLDNIIPPIFSISIGFNTRKTVPTAVTGAETIVINQDLLFNVRDGASK